jgi:thymidylate synthase (FAD)
MKRTNNIKTVDKVATPVTHTTRTKATLVSYSTPSEEFKEEGLDDVKDLVAYCARVSNPSNQLNKETADKLIGYLIKHQHWSPLEMVSACIEIETTRDIARQILRHRSFSFQEFSQRYADPTKDLSFMLREARLQDTKNRQNSIENNNEVLSAMWRIKQENVIKNALSAYNWAIENGIAKEQARAVLPEGNTMSRMYMNGTIRSWIHYIDLRSKNGTQKEHIEVALACAQAIDKIFKL